MSLPGSVEVRVGNFLTKKPLPYKVNLHLPPIVAKPDPRVPRTVGPELDVVVPQDDTRHTKLGIFMNAWSQLESTLSYLLSKLLRIDWREADLTFGRLGMKGAIDLLDAVGLRKLDDADSKALTALTERLSKLNTKRNILVHGHWVLEANTFVKGNDAILITQFLREITPVDPEEAKAMGNPRNQKERVRYAFTLKRIDAAARDTDTLNHAFINFTERMDFKWPSVDETLHLLSQSQPYRVIY